MVRVISACGRRDRWDEGEIRRAVEKFEAGIARFRWPQWVKTLMHETFGPTDRTGPRNASDPELPYWAKGCLLGKVSRAPRSLAPSGSGPSKRRRSERETGEGDVRVGTCALRPPDKG